MKYTVIVSETCRYRVILEAGDPGTAEADAEALVRDNINHDFPSNVEFLCVHERDAVATPILPRRS